MMTTQKYNIIFKKENISTSIIYPLNNLRFLFTQEHFIEKPSYSLTFNSIPNSRTATLNLILARNALLQKLYSLYPFEMNERDRSNFMRNIQNRWVYRLSELMLKDPATEVLNINKEWPNILENSKKVQIENLNKNKATQSLQKANELLFQKLLEELSGLKKEWPRYQEIHKLQSEYLCDYCIDNRMIALIVWYFYADDSYDILISQYLNFMLFSMVLHENSILYNSPAVHLEIIQSLSDLYKEFCKDTELTIIETLNYYDKNNQFAGSITPHNAVQKIIKYSA